MATALPQRRTPYIDAINGLDISEESREKLIKEAGKLYSMQPSFPETAVIRNYLDACLELPWNNKTDDNINIKKAQKILDAGHYGLTDVKKRIIELLAVRKLNPGHKGADNMLGRPAGRWKNLYCKIHCRVHGQKICKNISWRYK